MKRHPLKNFLSFLLALVSTMTAVGALSLVTEAKTDPSLAVEAGARSAGQLTATVEQGGPSVFLCAGAFLLILLLVAAGLVVLYRGYAGGRDSRGKRRYSPRADMSFPQRF